MITNDRLIQDCCEIKPQIVQSRYAQSYTRKSRGSSPAAREIVWNASRSVPAAPYRKRRSSLKRWKTEADDGEENFFKAFQGV